MDDCYFLGYELSDGLCRYDLTPYEESILDACAMLVDHKLTIREAADNCCFPKSTLHTLIHTKLPKLSYELYRCVLTVLKDNKTRKVRRY